jgi:ribosomal protein S18 acetylase RimI-like enzyme
MTDTATGISTTVKPLDPSLDSAAAEVLARCPALGTTENAAGAVQAARQDDDSSLFGLFVEGELAGAYILRKVQLSNEISYLAISPNHERRGNGKMCLYDALLRSGKRPLVVEADDSNLGFFKSCGFKLVGKRKGPDGSPRYRLGWHAPIPKPGGAPGEVVC